MRVVVAHAPTEAHCARSGLSRATEQTRTDF